MSPEKKEFLEKHFLFGLNLLTFFVYGTSLSAFGISLQEYQRNIHMTMSELSFGVSLSAVFGCVSCLMAAWTLDFKKFNRQLQFSVFMIIYGLVTVIYPLCTNYSVYIGNSILAGGIIAYINSIPSIWVVELFQENAKHYVQILHFVFPIGELAGPIIVSPFLRDDKNFTIEYSPAERAAIANRTADEGFFERLFDVTKTSNLWIPYMGISSLKITIGILVFIAYMVKPYKKSESTETIKSSTDSCNEYDVYLQGKRDLSRKYYLLFSALVCLIVGLNWCNEQNMYNYISTYLQNTKNLTEKTASYGQGLLSIAITIGRLLNIFITMKIKVRHMLFVNFVVMVAGNIVLIANDYSGSNSLSMAFVGIALIGLGFSSLHPFLISFVEERISMCNRLVAFMTLASNTFTTFAAILIGDILDYHAERFIVLNLVITSAAFILYIFLSALESIRLAKIVRTFGISKSNDNFSSKSVPKY